MSKRNTVDFLLRRTAALFSVLLFLSCDTEYVDKVNNIPGDVIKVPGYNQIESFIIKDAENNPVSAAITESSIVITWSNHMVLPETIKPEIILGQEAVIAPASGAEIPFKDGAVFTVTSKAGTKKQYTLKIDLRQKQPRPWTISSGEVLYKGDLQQRTNNGFQDNIDNLWLSLKDTKVYFVSATNQTEYVAETVYVGKGTGTAPYLNYGVYYFLPENMPLGFYELRIKNGAYILQNASVENRFKVEIAEPEYFKTERYGFPATKKTGETLEIRGGLLNTITAATLYNTANSAVTYPLEIVSLTSYKVVLKIPANVPAGSYNRIRYTTGEDNLDIYSPVTIN
ncbi:hypothetical protein [Flavobacterium poyangense]|uniref:hypothetical protein n=1 Tax=Flavobacterium poyangense TaxID=2204302 RepID=UPI00142161D3|nr:hypothetical protein [Flavobacterium sp. JXAS1]